MNERFIKYLKINIKLKQLIFMSNGLKCLGLDRLEKFKKNKKIMQRGHKNCFLDKSKIAFALL
jgi:hypothetical protein